jgi:hypothetical protein
MGNRLGYLEPFIPEDTPFNEYAQFGLACSEIGTGEHGGQVDLTKALAAPRLIKGCHSLPQAVDGPTIVTLSVVGRAEVLVR